MKGNRKAYAPLCDAPCSFSSSSDEGIALPNQHGGIEDLMTREVLLSWIPKGANLVLGGDLAPGIDLVILLESPDGIINHLRIISGVVGKDDTPRIVQQCGASCRLSVLWNEVEVVDGILLPFNSGPSFASFLGQLVRALSHLEDLSLNSSTNVKHIHR